MERQGDIFLQRLFDRFAERESVPIDTFDSLSFPEDHGSSNPKRVAMLKPTGLQKALLELGVQMDLGQVETLFVSMDLDNNVGLEFEEFRREVQVATSPANKYIILTYLQNLLIPIQQLPTDCKVDP